MAIVSKALLDLMGKEIRNLHVENQTLRTQVDKAKAWLIAYDEANDRENYPLTNKDLPRIAGIAREEFRKSLEEGP